jgi:hypothetical protein
MTDDRRLRWAGMYKFEKLEVWQLAIAYVDRCYEIS